MLLHCHNKKCNAPTDQLLKQDTNEVICMNCGNTNDTISEIMKSTLRASKHFYKAEFKKAFMFMCNKCTINREVVLKVDKVYCKACDTHLHVQPTVIEAIKSTLKFAEQDAALELKTTIDTDRFKFKKLKNEDIKQ